jgi:aminoglycoside phosphotransferase (APT) family kinase protein
VQAVLINESPHTATAVADEALNLSALTRHLDSSGVPRQGPLRAEMIAGGRSNLTFLVFDDVSTWILRRPPLRGATPSAHDMRREYQVTSALHNTTIQVARPVLLCEDIAVLGAPFTLVDYVAGQVIRTDHDLQSIDSADELGRCTDTLIDVLAALHAVDPVSVGLGEFGRGDGYLDRQVRRWGMQWEVVRSAEESCNADVARLRSRLAESIPQQGDTGIVHGDYRIDNTILDPTHRDRIRAVVDWELSTLGDPLADVALMCVYRHRAFDFVIGEPAAWTSSRWPTADELAHKYSTVSGRPLRHWPFYMALGYFKLAVIAAGIDYRRRSVDGVCDSAGEAVGPLVAEGLSLLKW